MITVHLLRHGETIWHRDNRYAGRSDIPLNDRGKAQAAAVQPWARAARLTAVASSDLERAVVTAATVAHGAGIPACIDDRLREVDFGRGEGLTRAQMRERFPVELDSFLRAPATHPLPGGEPGEKAVTRALDALADTISGVPDDARLAVVAHTTIIRLILCRTLGLPLDDYRRRFPSLGNVTVTTLRLPYLADGAGLTGAGALERYNCPVSGS